MSLLGLLRNLCANERCREQAMKAGAAKVVISLLKAYPGDMSIQEPGCGCVAAMSLRNADFALQLAEAGGVKVSASPLCFRTSLLNFYTKSTGSILGHLQCHRRAL